MPSFVAVQLGLCCWTWLETLNTGFSRVLTLDIQILFFQMFSCRQGHTEGKTSVVFLLISANTLYILSQREGGKFSREVTIPFLDIDFVSVSKGSHISGMVCTQPFANFSLIW